MFPTTPETLLAMLQLQKANLPEYQIAVGATAADIAEVTEDAANLEYLLQYSALAEVFKKSVTGLKDAVYRGDPNQPVPTSPAIAALVAPFDPRAGCVARARERNRRFKAAKGFTNEIGVALGMINDQPRPSPSHLQAALRVADAGDHQYTVEFKKQGMNGMCIQQRVKGTETWSDGKTALASPVVVFVNAPSGEAVQMEVRARLMKGNEQVGEWSPIYPLTVSS